MRLLLYTSLLGLAKGKICGQSFGTYGHEKSEIGNWKEDTECHFKIYPDKNGKIRFHSVRLQDNFKDETFLQPDCDIMQIYVRKVFTNSRK